MLNIFLLAILAIFGSLTALGQAPGRDVVLLPPLSEFGQIYKYNYRVTIGPQEVLDNVDPIIRALRGLRLVPPNLFHSGIDGARGGLEFGFCMAPGEWPMEPGPFQIIVTARLGLFRKLDGDVIRVTNYYYDNKPLEDGKFFHATHAWYSDHPFSTLVWDQFSHVINGTIEPGGTAPNQICASVEQYRKNVWGDGSSYYPRPGYLSSFVFDLHYN